MSSTLEKKILAIAKDVYNTLGSGFDEKVYENAMMVGLRLEKIGYESQKVLGKILSIKNTYYYGIKKITTL